MPEIPLSPIPNLVDTTVEGTPIDPNSVGNTERAFARVFAQAADTGFDILANRKRQEDDDFVDNALLKDQRDLSREMLEAQYETPADGSGYTDRVKAFAKERLQANGDAAPSEDAKRAYFQKAGTLYSTAVVKSELYEADARNRVFTDNFELQSNATAKSVLDLPDHSEAMAQWDVLEARLQKAVATKRITPQRAAELSLKGRNVIAKGLLDGYYNSERYEEGLAVLLGQIKSGDVVKNEPGTDYIDMSPAKAAEQGFITDEEARELESKGAKYRQPLGGAVEFSGLGFSGQSPFIEAISENEKDQYIKQYKRAMLISDGDRVASINSRVQDTRLALLNGADFVEAGGPQLITDIRMNRHLSKQQKVTLIDDVISADVTGQAMAGLRNVPRSQWVQIEQGLQGELEKNKKNLLKEFPSEARVLNTTAFNAVTRFRDDAALDQAKKNLIKEQERDAALYAIVNTPGIRAEFSQAQDWKSPQLTQNYVERTLRFQRDAEIPANRRRILPVQAAGQEAKFLKNAANGQIVSDRIGQLQAAFGPHFPRVWNEIAGKDDQLGQYLLISHIPVKESRERIINAIRNKGDIDKAFKESGRIEKDLHAEMTSTMADFNMASIGGSRSGNRLEFINSVSGAVRSEAKRILVSNPSMTEKEAVQAAYSLVVGFNYQTVSGGRSKVIAPAVVPGMRSALDKKLLGSFLSSHESKEAFSQMDTAIFPGVRKTWEAQQIPQAEWKDRWAEQLAKRSRWVNTPAQDGVQLIYDDPTYGPVQVTSNSGEPISYSFNKIMSGKFPTSGLMYQENKGFFERVFGK